MNIVLGRRSAGFAYVHRYPDTTIINSGVDFSAALYLSEALNFNIRWEIYSSATCKCKMCANYLDIQI